MLSFFIYKKGVKMVPNHTVALGLNEVLHAEHDGWGLASSKSNGSTTFLQQMSKRGCNTV